jgi:hypothetical protein
MQAAQYIFHRAGVIVLYESYMPADDLIKLPLIEAFIEKTARVAKNFGLQEINIGYCQLCRIHAYRLFNVCA